ncbi:alpha/beta hydrolase [Muricoccus radiodurans]|uniref:alpha/beta hydrolase n=1 Tax=Muricoccus radiodurans TaxID=2231721 RepID=UPI003CE8430A
MNSPPGSVQFSPRDGAAARTWLVLLHGAACGPWVWAEGFGQRLADRGHGGIALPLSRPGEEASLSDTVASVRRMLDGPVVFVGHSLGALVAQRLLAHPGVRGAALLAPVPPEGLWWSNSRLALSDPSLWAEVAGMVEPSAPPTERLVEGLFGPHMDRAAAWRHVARLGAESRSAILEAQMPQPVTPGWVLGRRVMVLGAEGDRLIPEDAVRRCAAWHGTGAAFARGMGHLLMLDAGWEAVADRVADWLDGLGA